MHRRPCDRLRGLIRINVRRSLHHASVVERCVGGDSELDLAARPDAQDSDIPRHDTSALGAVIRRGDEAGTLRDRHGEHDVGRIRISDVSEDQCVRKRLTGDSRAGLGGHIQSEQRRIVDLKVEGGGRAGGSRRTRRETARDGPRRRCALNLSLIKHSPTITRGKRADGPGRRLVRVAADRTGKARRREREPVDRCRQFDIGGDICQIDGTRVRRRQNERRPIVRPDDFAGSGHVHVQVLRSRGHRQSDQNGEGEENRREAVGDKRGKARWYRSHNGFGAW